MSDMEDLDTPETRSFTSYEDDSWEQFGDDDGCIVFLPDGSFGHVHLVKYDRRCRLYPPLDDEALAPLLIKLASCVGRITAVYSSKSGNIKHYRGSGIWISPTKVLTAKHVIKSPRIVEDEELNLTELYIDTQATTNQFEPTECIRLQIPSKETLVTDPDTKGFYLETLENGDQRFWKTHNDFVLASPIDKDYLEEDFATPVLYESKPGKSSCAVIGYPVEISLAKFKDDYHDSVRNLSSEDCYYAVSQSIGGFTNRIISQNNSFGDEKTFGVLRHDCPTLRGTSGGLLVDLETLKKEGKPIFTGLHLGGNIRMHTNFALATSFPPIRAALGL